MIHDLPRRTEYVFQIVEGNCLKTFSRYFFHRRKIVAEKTKNPRILRINFKSLRHFKATMEYQRTKDILHVKELLGHKNIKNTLVYTHLVNFKTDEYVVKVAKTLDSACQLLEAGFEYVTDYEGKKIFRKRK
jgi:integrase